MREKTNTKTKAYFVGGGIASLAGAAFLIKDGGFLGENITIFEESALLGGSLDAKIFSDNKLCFMRGFRMFEEKVYSSTFELFSFIPSVKNPQKTLGEDFVSFNKKFKTYSRSRLIRNGKKISAKPLKLALKDRIHLVNLLFYPEIFSESVCIENYFTPHFFKTNFWIEFCTTFSFQPWHSLAEFRRYLLRFLQDAPVLDTIKCVRSTPYNQYDSIVLPVLKWLQARNVRFKTKSKISDIIFKEKNGLKSAVSFHYFDKTGKNEICLNKKDLLFITLGSITANSSIGSMKEAPKIDFGAGSAAWNLWENITKTNQDFGNPYAFNSNVAKTKWISFTINSKDPVFFKAIKQITQKPEGTEGLISFKNSNWLITIGIPPQPHFMNQPAHIDVCWGYGLFPDNNGNFIKKTMSMSSGEDILIEICSHLNFSKKKIKKIIETSCCIPCIMPYITSQFLPRKKGDRPEVVPEQSVNFAFIGQYCEIPDDIVFTVEYSIRSAQIAVYSLLGLGKVPAPIYKGHRSIKILWNAIKTAFR